MDRLEVGYIINPHSKVGTVVSVLWKPNETKGHMVTSFQNIPIQKIPEKVETHFQLWKSNATNMEVVNVGEDVKYDQWSNEPFVYDQR